MARNNRALREVAERTPESYVAERGLSGIDEVVFQLIMAFDKEYRAKWVDHYMTGFTQQMIDFQLDVARVIAEAL